MAVSELSLAETAEATTVGVDGGVPPPASCVFATSVYASPTTRGPTLSVYDAPVPLQPFASVTFTVMVNEPVCDGEPERTPLAESVTPAGSAPLAREKTAGPCVPTPLCPNEALNGVP